MAKYYQPQFERWDDGPALHGIGSGRMRGRAGGEGEEDQQGKSESHAIAF